MMAPLPGERWIVRRRAGPPAARAAAASDSGNSRLRDIDEAGLIGRMARPDSFDGLSELLAIARCGSFRGAAVELGVTPSAVSQALQSLERRLGLPLFHRTTRKVAPTEAGERLLAQLAPAAQ